MNDLEFRLKKTIAQRLGISAEQLHSETRFVEDLGVDSLDSLDLLNALNEEFAIQITPEQMQMIHTYQEMVNAVTDLIMS